jgi:hypothetical protein
MYRSELRDLSFNMFTDYERPGKIISSKGFFSYIISEKLVSANIYMRINFLDDTLY